MQSHFVHESPANSLNPKRLSFFQNPVRWNEHKIAQLNAERETPEYKSRTSRLQKWKELVVQAHKELELPEEAPSRVMPLGQ